jgi:hypothetical protein
MTDTGTCVATLQEVEHYRRKQGAFSKVLAEKMAYDSSTFSGKALKF